jgi:hypothetical protein
MAAEIAEETGWKENPKVPQKLASELKGRHEESCPSLGKDLYDDVYPLYISDSTQGKHGSMAAR